ncbi:MAG TPA: hypothetical protein PLT65_01915 [Bacilli bacterium]|nr:hypothetical protein [Bacilli bacterium]
MYYQRFRTPYYSPNNRFIGGSAFLLPFAAGLVAAPLFYRPRPIYYPPYYPPYPYY